jgi:hypothetical protein
VAAAAKLGRSVAKRRGKRMLETLNGKRISGVPHREDFDALLHRLGPKIADAIRRYLDGIIDELPPDSKTGLRTFNSSHLGSKLSPWPEPLAQLYKAAWEFLGNDARDEDVENQAALWFGLFVWERIMEREELWVFYDPNLSANDPNRDPTGKVYFERCDD